MESVITRSHYGNKIRVGGAAKPEMRVRLSIWSGAECGKQSANGISPSASDRRRISRNDAVSVDSHIISILKGIASLCSCCRFISCDVRLMSPCGGYDTNQLGRVHLQPFVTCWSIPTASRPWYIMLTQPSFEASTNRDMSAWRRHTNGLCEVRRHKCGRRPSVVPAPGCRSCTCGEPIGNWQPGSRTCW